MKAARLARSFTQAELAARAGVARGALIHLERTGASTLSTFVRVARALGLEAELQPLFLPQVQSIAQMEKIEGIQRKRAPRTPRQRRGP
jgi:transcriptional regulator with XRE-family HTH domain